jgi:hypothetical protein
MRRWLFAILLVLQTLGFATILNASESEPIPICFPCPDGR